MSIARRDVLRAALTGAVAATIPCAASAEQRKRLTSLGTLVVDTPIAFSWPDEASPALLVKLGRAALGGVGPERDIVAFSAVCTHRGCPVHFEGGRLLCPCHWSQFDPALDGVCFAGPAPVRLPRVLLEIEGEDIFAVGATGQIWGRFGDLA